IRVAREADIRYAGQSMEVRVAAPAGEIDSAFLAALIDAFHAAHLRTFGYNYAGEQKIELVNFCVSGFGLVERPRGPNLSTGARRASACGRSTSTAPSARPLSTSAQHCRPRSVSTTRPWLRSSARPPWFFPARNLKSTRMAS